MIPQRKYPRLKDKSLYNIPGMVAHITIGTENKTNIFCNDKLSSLFKKVLIRLASEKSFPIHAYCIMPDHIHLLLESTDEYGIIDFVKILKGNFAAECRRCGIKVSGLQRSFYDHLVRKNEDLLTIAKYILNNPVRKGIVRDYKDYHFCGSLVYDL